MPIISAAGLSRTFQTKRGPVEAVRGIDLTVRPGEILGLLGPNGAGKTTTLRMLTTLLPPTGGAATVAERFKALGFRSRRVVWMVIGQALTIGLASAAIGLAGAPALVSAFVSAVERAVGPMPDVGLDAVTVVVSVLAVSAVSLLAAAAPAVHVARLQVAEGLRRAGA